MRTFNKNRMLSMSLWAMRKKIVTMISAYEDGVLIETIRQLHPFCQCEHPKKGGVDQGAEYCVTCKKFFGERLIIEGKA